MRHLFDHTARVHRLTETVNEYREAVNAYVAGATIPCALVPPKFRPAQTDAGTRLDGLVELYADADADLQMNDVLEVLTGPEAPTMLRVLHTARPRGHHTEAQCEPFTGALEAAA